MHPPKNVSPVRLVMAKSLVALSKIRQKPKKKLLKISFRIKRLALICCSNLSTKFVNTIDHHCQMVRVHRRVDTVAKIEYVSGMITEIGDYFFNGIGDSGR